MPEPLRSGATNNDRKGHQATHIRANCQVDVAPSSYSLVASHLSAGQWGNEQVADETVDLYGSEGSAGGFVLCDFDADGGVLMPVGRQVPSSR
jgi:hypothetical protein